MLAFWAGIGFIIIMSYVMHILLEAPFGVLEGMLMPKRKPKPTVEHVDTKVPPTQETSNVEKVTTETAASPAAADN